MLKFRCKVSLLSDTLSTQVAPTQPICETIEGVAEVDETKSLVVTVSAAGVMLPVPVALRLTKPYTGLLSFDAIPVMSETVSGMFEPAFELSNAVVPEAVKSVNV